MSLQSGTGVYHGGNAILDRLTPPEREALLPRLSVFFAEETSVLHERDQPIGVVYFPIDAIFSVVVELGRGQMYEVGVIGRGGAVGAELAVGARMTPRTVLCQAGGHVADVPGDQFAAALERSPAFLTAVRESLRRQWFDSQQTVACNFAHAIEQRAARWILMTHDEIGHAEFPLRAEFLSIMLGIGEAQILKPLAVLAELGCIRYEDARLTVLSRERLHEHACECYDHQRTAPFITVGAP